MPVSPRSPIEFSVLQQAADWFSILQAESVDERERQLWRQWFLADATHQRAWQRVEAVSRRFGAVADGGLPCDALATALDANATLNMQRRRAIKLLMLACGTSVMAWGSARVTPWPQAVARWNADHRSGVGEISEVALADGGQLWLDTDSAVDLDYSRDQRRLILRGGAVLIQTAADSVSPPRPFVVDTSEGRLRALGTRFSVRQGEEGTDVAVFEGAVELRPRSGALPVRIEAGQQARLLRDAVTSPEPADPAREAWTRGLMLAEHLRLEDFIAELARYRRGYLACAPEVAGLRVAGAYPLNNPDQALAMLAAALPVRIHARQSWWVTVEALP